MAPAAVITRRCREGDSDGPLLQLQGYNHAMHLQRAKVVVFAPALRVLKGCSITVLRYGHKVLFSRVATVISPNRNCIMHRLIAGLGAFKS